MIEPGVSVPMETPHRPAAVAEPDPAEDPLEPSFRLQGLRVVPPYQMSEPLVRACLMPYSRRLEAGDPQWQCFAAFVGRSVWDGQLSALMGKSFDEVAKVYIAAFRRALPGLGPADAVRGFRFLTALMHAAAVRDARIEGLIASAGGETAPGACSRILVPCIAAGFRAISEGAQQTD